jgi:catechol 2,3-dioxygenase-like lactoylglutathione lyase family enzyme
LLLMLQSLARIGHIVRDYDEAIGWFTEKLDFTLVADEYQPEQDKPGAISAEGSSEIATRKRWVLVAPPGAGEGAATILLPSAAFERCFASPEPWATPPAPRPRSKPPSSATTRAGASSCFHERFRAGT